jgi:hypothetical protein
MIRLGRLLRRWPNTSTLTSFSSAKTTAVDHHEDHDDHDDHDDHGHGHHAKPYDWRNDFTKNPEYVQDILNRGCQDPSTYHAPFDAPMPQWVYSHPANYNPRDLTTNLVSVKHIGPINNKLRVLY